MGQVKYNILFDGIDTKIELGDGRKVVPINFDNGATTPPLKVVNDKVWESIKYYGSIGRGSGVKGDYCTAAYEDSKYDVLNFLGVANNPNYQVVYVKNTTEGINLLANILGKDGIVLTTRMEHHSNDLPWRKNSQVIYVETNREGRVKIEHVMRLFRQYKDKIKYLAITGASNVTGYINPIYELANIAHSYGAKIIVDGAQLVAHREIKLDGNNKGEAIDFIVFSGHKIYAPYGIGAVVGRFNEIEDQASFMLGGGTVDRVGDDTFEIACPPDCYEAGTPNFLGAIALGTALKELKKIGYGKIVEHENYLKEYLIDNLMKIENVILYGDCRSLDDRIGVIPFNIKYKSCEEIAETLAYRYGIATRFGKFCAHPYVERMIHLKGVPLEQTPSYYGEYGLVRVSLGLYNTLEEVDYFIKCIKEISEKN